MLVRSLDQEDPLEKGMITSPVFLSGESHRERNLVGYSPWGHKRHDQRDLAGRQVTYLGFPAV